MKMNFFNENDIEKKERSELKNFIKKVFFSLSPAKIKNLALAGMVFFSTNTLDAYDFSAPQKEKPEINVYQPDSFQENTKTQQLDSIPLYILESNAYKHIKRIQKITPDLDSLAWDIIFKDFDKYQPFFEKNYVSFLENAHELTKDNKNTEIGYNFIFNEQTRGACFKNKPHQEKILQLLNFSQNSNANLSMLGAHREASRDDTAFQRALTFYANPKLITLQKKWTEQNIGISISGASEGLFKTITGPASQVFENFIEKFHTEYPFENFYNSQNKLEEFFTKNKELITLQPKEAVYLLGTNMRWKYRTPKESPIAGSLLSYLVESNNLKKTIDRSADAPNRWYEDTAFVKLAFTIEQHLYPSPDSLSTPKKRLAAQDIYATTYNFQKLNNSDHKPKTITLSMVQETKEAMTQAFNHHKNTRIFKDSDIALIADGFDGSNTSIAQSFHRGKEIPMMTKNANSFFYGISPTHAVNKKEEQTILNSAQQHLSQSTAPVLILKGHGTHQKSGSDFWFNSNSFSSISPADATKIITGSGSTTQHPFLYSDACFSGSFVLEAVDSILQKTPSSFVSLPIFVGGGAPDETHYGKTSLSLTNFEFYSDPYFKSLALYQKENPLVFEDFLKAPCDQIQKSTIDQATNLSLPTILVPYKTKADNTIYIMLPISISQEK